MSDVAKFDSWLTTEEFAALTARQPLESVDGPDGVIFPPTFAAETEGEKGNYNIDYFGGHFTANIRYQHPVGEKLETEITHDKGGSVCLINSVGAEANRIEPLFRPDKCNGQFASLVPQVVIKAGNQRVNLLDAGHRAGDAIVRFTKFGEKVFDAFRSLLDTGNAEPLAQIAPTSIVFGVWDSRGTQAKLPRVFRSVVRAYNVSRVKRSAQFNRAIKYVENGLIDETLDKGEGDKNPLSREGFKDNPATAAPGGVIVEGGIRRDMTVNLSAIRRLRVPHVTDVHKTDPERTLKLQRYILGLTLVAATTRNEERFDLREGCQLRVKPGEKTTWQAVRYEGKDEDLTGLTSEAAVAFAKLAASEFGIAQFEEFEFDQKTAEKWLALDKKTQDKRRRDNPMTKQFPDAEIVTGSAGEGVMSPPDESASKPSPRKKRGQ